MILFGLFCVCIVAYAVSAIVAIQPPRKREEYQYWGSE
jgi:hypothetical protein